MVITLDIETDSLYPEKAIIHLIGYRLEGTTEVVQIERPERDKPNDKLFSLLSDAANTIRGHNVKFDCLCLSYYGYVVACKLDDTRLLAYLRWPDEPSDLKSLVVSKLHRPVVTLENITIKPRKKKRGLYERSKRFVQVGTGFVYLKILKTYNRADIVNCDALRNVLPDTPWYTKCEQPLLRLLFDSELRGSYLDRDYLDKFDVDLAQEIAPRYEYLKKEVENPNSTLQVAQAYVKMGFDLSKLADTTPKGKPKIDKMFLKRLSWKGHEFSRTLLEYRKLEKIRTTYIQSFLQRMDNERRIHGSFNQAGSETEEGDKQGTRTGRLTASEPNLQNIPARSEIGRAVRKAFISTPGWLQFDFDLKQIEPRLIAHYSQSKKLLNAFANKVDTHAMFGSDIFGIAPDKLTKTERFIGKTSWLATFYGCWYKKLLHICEVLSDEPLAVDTTRFLIGFDSLHPKVRQLLISKAISEEAARERWAKEAFFNEVQENFRKKNPELMDWRRAHIERTKRIGYITTIGGRRVEIQGLSSKNEWEVSKAERLAVNYQIQGSAADIMKIILVRFKNEGCDTHRVHLTAVVHDEILGEAKSGQDIEFVKEIMEDTVHLNNVAIECEGGLISNWGDKK